MRARFRHAGGPPPWASWTVTVLLALDVVSVLFLVWVAFTATGDEGERAPAVYIPLAFLSAACGLAGSLTLARYRQRAPTWVGVTLLLVAPAVAYSAPYVFTGTH